MEVCARFIIDGYVLELKIENIAVAKEHYICHINIPFNKCPKNVINHIEPHWKAIRQCNSSLI